MKRTRDANKKQKKKKKAKSIMKEKERVSEDWCFVCKDGGDLILCDHDDCLKVYHPKCVGKEDSEEENGAKWICDRHSCFSCHNVPQFYCYCCPKSVCRGCTNKEEFVPIKGRNGLCDSCMELVLFVEETEDFEIDGVDGDRIDLQDRNTFECLFLEYWDIIKEEEDLTYEDVCSAAARSKKNQKSSKSYAASKHKKKDESITSGDDSDDSGESGIPVKNKGSKALEFLGWGSKPLIEFLNTIGEDTTEELSQHAVESIIRKYIQEQKLRDPRKKKIICDDKLYAIFRRKSINKNNLFHLLEAHFSANLDQSDESEKDDVESNFHGNKESIVMTKRQKTVSPSEDSQDSKADIKYQESCFASIVSENIKFIYLKKSLIEELLLNEPESFEGKVVGSFVRVKGDTKDYTKKNSYQLLQVIGIQRASMAINSKDEILLQVYNMPCDVHVNTLSDSDFCEEEIDDLREKIEKGLLPKLRVVELEEKARCLHENVTKHWIQKELVRLQNRIDFANERGWRRDYTMAERLAQRETLKKPSTQERLLQQQPKIIAEPVGFKNESADSLVEDAKQDLTPKSILTEGLEISRHITV